MVLSDLCGSGNDRRLLKFLLSVLRDFDFVHKEDLDISDFGLVDFEEKRIYVSKHECYEDDDTFLHELRHVFRNFYSTSHNYSLAAHEEDAAFGAAVWYKKIYEDLIK